VRTNLDVGGNSTGAIPVFRAFGQENEFWSTIEGVLVGGVRQMNGTGMLFDYSPIDETTVQTVGTNADNPTHGINMNVIIKTGGNDFHGTGFFSGTHRKLSTQNITDAQRAGGLTGANTTTYRADVSGDVGGRIIRDKVWFYQSARYFKNVVAFPSNFTQPDGSPMEGTYENPFATTKVSYQVNSTNRIVAFYQYSHQKVFGGLTSSASSSRFTMYEALPRTDYDINVGKAEWQHARGRQMISLQGGGWNWAIDQVGITPDKPATTDQLTQVVGGNSVLDGRKTREGRHHWKGAYNLYAPGFYGNHEFKTGFDFDRASTRRHGLVTPSGNYQLVFRNGAASFINAFNSPTTPRQDLRYIGLFVQDNWTIARRLTISAGVRYAHDAVWIQEQCRDAAPAPLSVAFPASCFPAVDDYNVWNPISPRVNFAYDLTGVGTTVLKGGYGRYHHRRYTDELQIVDRNISLQSQYRWTDPNGNKVFDAGEVNLSPNGPDFVSTTIREADSGSALGVTNPDEKEPYTDDWNVSFERELFANFGVRVTSVYSRTFNTYRILNTLRPPSAYTVRVSAPDPGPDGARATGDDPGTTLTYFEYPAALAGQAFQRPTLANDENADRSYKSIEIAAMKRMSHRWQMLSSFSATKSNIPFVTNSGGTVALQAVTWDPNAEILASDNTWEWLGKVQGAYSFPKDLSLSATLESRSGAALARTVSMSGGRTIPTFTIRTEPIGSIRLPAIHVINLRAEKGLRFGGRKVVGRVNLYNLLNSNTVTGQTTLSGTQFGRPTSILGPRVVEFSAQFSY
jgi:hypothetical protein